jgi:3-phenylpropionate/trans-cinnamate dioxygenase ferredoxin reductase subunit
MSRSGQSFVIVGASLAGAKAAETLRSEGFDGAVVLVGEEQARPYERPPLSKDYLRGEKGFDAAAVHPEGFYQEHDIELRLGTTVSALDPGGRTVTTSEGEEIGYDRLLLATGSQVRRLSLPGADLEGVHYLRSVEDADRLRRAIAPGTEVAVIGAGWIGSEVAASARQLGAEVALIEMAQVPLERVLGPEVGALYRDLHAAHGVRLHMGVGVDSLRGADQVEEVRLGDGTSVPAEVVVVGVGVTPRTELAEGAGLETDNGVVTDEHLATSVPGIFAAGDVANAFHPGYGERIRLEHWSAALNQGPAAARAMLGHEAPYDRTPYFFSDQYDLGMEYRGWARSWDQVVFRGDPAAGEFVCFWLSDGRVLAAMNANVWDAGEALEALVRRRAAVDPERLADPGTDLAGLVPEAP